MKKFWDERYNTSTYAYGENPNVFFKQELLKYKPGKLLMPAEGEGRNAVFAAKNGWQVEAFDMSDIAKEKALQLAAKNNCFVSYVVGDLGGLTYPVEHFDAIGLIYAHFTAGQRNLFHKKLTGFLKKGGLVILEAFSKNHPAYQSMDPSVGGPGNIDSLLSLEDIRTDFEGFESLVLEELIIELTEGSCHVGTGSVVRFVGRKL